MSSSICPKCSRFISLSTLPGGNPVALANPEEWSITYGFCRRCTKYFCDRCCSTSKHCPNCGSALEMGGPLPADAWTRKPTSARHRQTGAGWQMSMLDRIRGFFSKCCASLAQQAESSRVPTQASAGGSAASVSGQDKDSIPCPHCGTAHALDEQRIQGGEPETLRQAIEIMIMAEETMKKLDEKGAIARTTSGKRVTFSSILNRQNGWQCYACRQIILHNYLVDEGKKRGIRAPSRNDGVDG